MKKLILFFIVFLTTFPCGADNFPPKDWQDTLNPLASPDAETGKVTKFSFTIPKVLVVYQEQKEADKSTIAGAKILVVDDEDAVLEMYRAVLLSREAEIASDGELAALEAERFLTAEADAAVQAAE